MANQEQPQRHWSVWKLENLGKLHKKVKDFQPKRLEITKYKIAEKIKLADKAKQKGLRL